MIAATQAGGDFSFAILKVTAKAETTPSNTTTYMWKQWINLILGLVVVLGAYMGMSMTWFVVLGIIIALLALWAALEKKSV